MSGRVRRNHPRRRPEAGDGGRPLYARALGLSHIYPGGLLCFLLFEGAIALGILLALAELVSWWGVVTLPATVAVMVKINDAVAGTIARSAAARSGSVAGRSGTARGSVRAGAYDRVEGHERGGVHERRPAWSRDSRRGDRRRDDPRRQAAGRWGATASSPDKRKLALDLGAGAQRVTAATEARPRLAGPGHAAGSFAETGHPVNPDADTVTLARLGAGSHPSGYPWQLGRTQDAGPGQ